jgi:predicted nuclease with TOPRIM domain
MIKFTEQNVKLLEILSASLVGLVKNLNKGVSNDRSYNVKQTNLKVFLGILGILHENTSKKSNVMARISDIEIDMDTVQNKMWEAEKDKMKLELELEKGHDYMEELLNKIKFLLDTIDKSHSSWIRDNFLSDNIKNKIVEMEEKYG